MPRKNHKRPDRYGGARHPTSSKACGDSEINFIQPAEASGKADTGRDPVPGQGGEVHTGGTGESDQGSVICSGCIHVKECMEQRGPCIEYKTLEDVRKEIEYINENQKKVTRRPKNDTDGQR